VKRKASFIPDILSSLESPRTSHFNRFLKFLASLYGIASSLKIETTHTRVAVKSAAAGDQQKELEVRFESQNKSRSKDATRFLPFVRVTVMV
jgi:hypothetical protein